MTPQELEQQRQREAEIRAAEKRETALRDALSIGAVTVTAAAAFTPLDRINQTINTKIEDLKAKSITTLSSQASRLGIIGLETGNPQLPDLCPSQAILDQVLGVRNALGTDIENTAKYINLIDISLQTLSPIISATEGTIDVVGLLKTATSLANKFIPVIPGAAVALISDLDDLKTNLTFNKDGTPKLPEVKRAIQLGSQYVSGAALTLLSILILLQVVDLVLEKCGKQPSKLGGDVDTLLSTVKLAETSNIQSTYRGFTFAIVEKPFNSNLNQRIGQAKNSQGIVLLQTEPSFTQDPQVLVEELKLIINRDNLKAN
jgi:hypothetical protein